MKPYILTVTLNPAVDKTVNVDNFKTGRDFREQNISISAGGKGINVSRVLKHLGVLSLTSGFLGGSDGNYIKNQLDKEKIIHDFYPIKGNTRTSLTVIDPVANTITRILERGPAITKKDTAVFKKKFFGLIKNCRAVILSGRNIPGASDSFYRDLIRIAKRKNIISVFDTSGGPLEIGLEAKPFMIKPNLKESEQLLGRNLNSLTELKKALRYFTKCGITIAAITLGSKGAIVADGKQILQALPPKVRRKSPVGCGDAFIAGFIAAYLRNNPFSHCLKQAVACGTANVLSLNPGFIKPGTLKSIIRQVKIKEITNK
ncbi:MAG: 1-phosphofructokinase family hexose kinase [Candidatus Omnitrophota bacterium]